jgi:hypothetical protein
MTTATATFTKDDIGCYFDSARGIYIGEAIQELAGRTGLQNNVVITYVPCHHDDAQDSDGYVVKCPCPSEDDHGLWYDEATDEAEDFLNRLTAGDVAFGSNESGDWGLWHICDDEMDCTFCETS